MEGAVPYLVAAWIFLVGLYGIVTSRHLIHLVNCVILVQASTYVLLLAVGYRANGTAPLMGDRPPGAPMVDPVVQAMTLTDVVVGSVVAALLLAIAIQSQKRFGTLDPDELRATKG